MGIQSAPFFMARASNALSRPIVSPQVRNPDIGETSATAILSNRDSLTP